MLRLLVGQILYKILKPFGGYVLLSNGFVCRVRRMALYELDAVPYKEPEPFTYVYVNKKTGKEIRRVYDISQWSKPPIPPDRPEHECDPDSYEGELWHVYNTYQAALLHKLKQNEAAVHYAQAVSRYVLDSCISARAVRQIVSADDYTRVYQQALTPEVTVTEVEAALAASFPGIIRQTADT